MSGLRDATRQFLARDRIAVLGVSRDSKQPANLIYRKLRQTGHSVFAVNPNAERVEGDVCYRDVRAIPGGVEGAVVLTRPELAASAVEACAAAGVKQIWLHRSFGKGSVSDDAIERGRRLGLTVIPGACPMMFCEPIDVGHRCMRWILGWTGGLPDPVRQA